MSLNASIFKLSFDVSSELGSNSVLTKSGLADSVSTSIDDAGVLPVLQ
jgi:hypothetical protein